VRLATAGEDRIAVWQVGEAVERLEH